MSPVTQPILNPSGRPSCHSQRLLGVCGGYCQSMGHERQAVDGQALHTEDGPYPFRYSPPICAFLALSISALPWRQPPLGLDMTPAVASCPSYRYDDESHEPARLER